MKTFKEISNTREYKRKSLLNISVLHDNYFEKAIEENIKSLKEKIIISEIKYEELCKKNEGKEYSTLTPADFDLIDEECYYEANIESYKLHLHSLNEMRIIYLFKNLEISIKSIIKNAYPNTNTKDFFKWQILINFLSEKNIPITTVEGYTEAVQLKDVNNTIKHSDSIPQHISRLSEFTTGFTSEGLERFVQRVKPQVELFREKLSVEIAKERFDFNDDRIDSIVKEYRHRMDDIAFLNLIEKLNSKKSTES